MRTDFSKGLEGEAATLAGQNQALLQKLPSTFAVSIYVKLQTWPTLFEPEKAYFRTLLAELQSLSPEARQKIFGNLARFEEQSGVLQVRSNDPYTLENAQMKYLQRHGEYSAWRRQVVGLFDQLQPQVESRLYRAPLPTRVVVVIYGSGITIERNQLWQQLRNKGTRVPLQLAAAGSTSSYLAGIFGAAPALPAQPANLFQALRAKEGFQPTDSWLIEADDELHQLCERGGSAARDCATGLSYHRLESYRQQLSDSIYGKVLTGLRSPLELAAYLKTLDLEPHQGTTLFADSVVRGFIRDIFLAGAGTLILNNTFVEWASIQAFERAQPRLLVARFGVRDKLKPFSSLLLFAKPRAADRIPNMQDPLGSFVDAELLSYYIWLKSQELTPYRGRTLYVMLADQVDEALILSPAAGNQVASAAQPAPLGDLAAAMATWLGLPGATPHSHLLASLIS